MVRCKLNQRFTKLSSREKDDWIQGALLKALKNKTLDDYLKSMLALLLEPGLSLKANPRKPSPVSVKSAVFQGPQYDADVLQERVGLQRGPR